MSIEFIARVTGVDDEDCLVRDYLRRILAYGREDARPAVVRL